MFTPPIPCTRASSVRNAACPAPRPPRSLCANFCQSLPPVLDLVRLHIHIRRVLRHCLKHHACAIPSTSICFQKVPWIVFALLYGSQHHHCDRLGWCDPATDRQRCSYRTVRERRAPSVSPLERRGLTYALKHSRQPPPPPPSFRAAGRGFAALLPLAHSSRCSTWCRRRCTEGALFSPTVLAPVYGRSLLWAWCYHRHLW